MQQELEQPSSGAHRARFDELNVRVGARLQIVVSTFGRKSHLTSTLLGYAEGEYLIVRTPTEGGLAVRLQNGEPIDVRLFTGTHVAEFRTSLLRQFSAPISYWHLSYPEDVRVATLRAAPRTRVNLDAQVGRSSAEAVPVRLIDLSALGAKVLAPEPLGERGQKVELAFEIPRGPQGAAAQIAVAATIRGVKPLPAAEDAPPGYAHGLEFDNLSESDQVLLQNFVLQKLNETPATGV
ncbi:MAG: flagellar brake protein [Burkholderiaceae bacterium]|nr:flagellar brake protein [Burkholderiaceae bacterium]